MYITYYNLISAVLYSHQSCLSFCSLSDTHEYESLIGNIIVKASRAKSIGMMRLKAYLQAAV